MKVRLFLLTMLAATAMQARAASDFDLDALIKSLQEQEASQSVSIAKRLLGTPYRWGGTSAKTGFDCSGLVYYVFKQQNIDVPRVPKDMFVSMQSVPEGNLAPGDIVFFNTFGKLSHVGIYIGNREFIHAPTRGKTVAIDSLDAGYYSKRYVGARRVETTQASSAYSAEPATFMDIVAGL